MKISILPALLLLLFISCGCTMFHQGSIKVVDAEGNAVPQIPVRITRSEGLLVSIQDAFPSSGPTVVGHTNENGIFQFSYLSKEQNSWFLRLFGKKKIPRQTLTIEYEMPSGHKVNSKFTIDPR
jgi:hypothetical protein